MQTSSMGTGNMAAIMQQMQKTQLNFTAADKDKDGKLSKSEFSSFDSAMQAQGLLATPAGGAVQSADSLFSQMDTDADGSVSFAEADPPQNVTTPKGVITVSIVPLTSSGTLSELMKGQEASPTAANGGDGGLNDAVSSLLGKVKDAFTAADKDGDGKLSASEFADFDKSLQAMTQSSDATKTAETANIGNLFSKLDGNSDGGVSLGEVVKGLQEAAGGGAQKAATATADAATDATGTTKVAGGKGHGHGGGGGGKVYDELDTNKDGVVSAAELAAADPTTTTTADGSTTADAGSTGDIISSLIQTMMESYKQGAVGGALSALTSAIV